MDKEKYLDQENVNVVWRGVWKKEKDANAKKLFHQRLFIEGYPIFRKYIPDDTRSILEIGGGSGRYGLKFAQDLPECVVTSTDIVEESVGFIKKLVDELSLRNVSVKKEDVFHLSFPDNSFDVVFADVVIQHLPEDTKAVQEMARVVKPGGVLIISTMNVWNPHTLYKKLQGKAYLYGYEKSYTKKDLRNILKDSNLVVEGEDGFYFAYGIFRLKNIHPIFGFLGKVCNRMVKWIDSFTGRIISRYCGFEIVVIGKKLF